MSSLGVAVKTRPLQAALSDRDPDADNLAVGAYPGFVPRLVIGDDRREDIAAYRARGGYAPGLEGEPLIAEVGKARLRGRGGAAFPTATKLRTVASQPGPRFLIANGEEGEPASIKDRWLMRKRPHLVVDGALRGARAIGAAEAFVYVSDRAAEDSLELALVELGPTTPRLRISKVERSYVAGEETSAVRSLNGGPAKPTEKPPRPYQAGVQGRPTFVSNVETLANLPFIATHGAAGYSIGGNEGSALMSISGAVQRPGLYEVPLGLRLADVVQSLAGPWAGLRGFLMGGFFGGLVNLRALDLHLSYDALKAAGSGLGCGAIIAIGVDDCPIAAAADVMDFFARENAGQCGACMRGTPAMSRAITALGLGEISDAELNKLRGWSVSLRGRGACATLDGAAHLAASIFSDFIGEVSAHHAHGCSRCRSLLRPRPSSRFAVERAASTGIETRGP